MVLILIVWVNSIMSGRNPPLHCTLKLIAMQGHNSQEVDGSSVLFERETRQKEEWVKAICVNFRPDDVPTDLLLEYKHKERSPNYTLQTK